MSTNRERIKDGQALRQFPMAGLELLAMAFLVFLGATAALINVADTGKSKPFVITAGITDLEWIDISDEREVHDEAQGAER